MRKTRGGVYLITYVWVIFDLHTSWHSPSPPPLRNWAFTSNICFLNVRLMTDTHCNQLLVDNEFRVGISVSLDDVIIHATFCQQQLITTITLFHPCVTTLYLDCTVPPDWGHCSIVCNIPHDGLIILLSASRHSGSYILDIHVVVLRRQLYSCNCSIVPCHLEGNDSACHSNVVKLLG